MTRRRVELDEQDQEELLGDLERRVGWQVAVAYGLPLAEPAPEPASAPEPVPAPERVPAPEPVDEPAPPPVAAPEPPIAPVEPFSLPTVQELELLVRAREATEPVRAEEWLWSLSHLREFVDDEGRLPENFRATVEIVFRELLQAREIAAAA